MVPGDDPKQPDPANAAGDQASREVRLLAERIARLEDAVAALQRPMVAASPLATTEARSTPAHPPPPPLPILQSEAAAAATAWVRPEVPPVPAAATAGSGPQATRESSHKSLEDQLGSQIFNRVAIVLLLIGTALFLKLAIDRQWIGPVGRVLAGLLAGAGLVVWSERFRSKGFAAFSYSLKALGSGVLYLTLWAAFQLYHLLPAGVALALMLAVTGWNAFMAWAQDAELLAAYALAGGFATPMLLATGGNHETFLFTYLLAIDVATVVLVRLKAWPRLLLGAFPLTMAYFIGWYVQFYAASELALTAVFILLFDSTFSSVPIGRDPAAPAAAHAGRGSFATLIEDVLLPLANAAFLSLALYSVLQDAGHHAWLPWLMVLLAAVYLGFMRLPQSVTASAIHLSIGIVFLTIAIPLKASGHWITASWLVEGLALLWVATRLAPAALASETPVETESKPVPAVDLSPTLRGLALGALALGFCGVVFHLLAASFDAEVLFFSADVGTALTALVVFAGAAWLALRMSRSMRTSMHGRGDARASGWATVAVTAILAIDACAVLLALREVVAHWGSTYDYPPFQSAGFWMAVVALAVFAGVVAISLRVAREPDGPSDDPFWLRCAGFSTIAFNLVAVLTGVRELQAIWASASPSISSSAGTEAALQQALAVSAFLMLYGALVLAAGFWKRTAFLRWQGLLLLVLTIFKAFLYDMRNLSQGYRVASFLALGALLMAISFAYQKDWLSLRVDEGGTASGSAAGRGAAE